MVQSDLWFHFWICKRERVMGMQYPGTLSCIGIWEHFSTYRPPYHPSNIQSKSWIEAFAFRDDFKGVLGIDTLAILILQQ